MTSAIKRIPVIDLQEGDRILLGTDKPVTMKSALRVFTMTKVDILPHGAEVKWHELCSGMRGEQTLPLSKTLVLLPPD